MTQDSADEFDGKAALVTGGASGIGAAVVAALVARGARVLIVDLNADAAEALAHQLDPGGARVLGIATDVTQADQVETAVALAVTKFGRLDMAVNNAGIAQPPLTVARLQESDWRRVIDVNLTAVFLCLQHEIRAMLADGRGGAIVNMASALGTIGAPRASAYVAAKHGVIGLTRSAALDYAKRNVRINAIAPGVIETPLVQGAMQPGAQKQMEALHPIGRLGSASEVAEFVVFLLSPRAGFATGGVHLVDGGWTSH